MDIKVTDSKWPRNISISFGRFEVRWSLYNQDDVDYFKHCIETMTPADLKEMQEQVRAIK